MMAYQIGTHGCICLNARRATRRLSQIYDDALKPVGLTINQFGLLAYLYGAKLGGRDRLSVGALADFTGIHPRAVTRHLGTLKARGWVADAVEPADRRVRAVCITGKGGAQLRRAVSFWRLAQARVREMLGVDTTVALNGILDLTSAKLKKE